MILFSVCVSLSLSVLFSSFYSYLPSEHNSYFRLPRFLLLGEPTLCLVYPFIPRTHLSATCNSYLQLRFIQRFTSVHGSPVTHESTRRIRTRYSSSSFLIILYINTTLSLWFTKRRCFIDMYRFERIRDEIEGTCSFDILNSSADLLSVVQLAYQGIGKRFLNSCSVWFTIRLSSHTVSIFFDSMSTRPLLRGVYVYGWTVLLLLRNVYNWSV